MDRHASPSGSHGRTFSGSKKSERALPCAVGCLPYRRGAGLKKKHLITMRKVIMGASVVSSGVDSVDAVERLRDELALSCVLFAAKIFRSRIGY